MSSQLYRDLTIDPDQGEIRLLEIIPDLNDTVIKCVCQKAFLSTHPDFIALSYTWESIAESGEIISEEYIIQINGYDVPVKHNLYQFLLQARKRDKRFQRIWVDAVCIDQENKIEKGRAVSMMGDIYSRASSVLAWLGTATSATDQVFGYANSYRFAWKHLLLRYGPWQDIGKEKIGFLEEYCMGYSNEFTKLQQLIHTLFSKRYWTRYWIVQEIMLSRKLYIVCGDKELSWEKCYSALLMFQRTRAVRENLVEADGVLDTTFTEFLLRSKGYYLTKGRKDPLPLYEALLLFFHKGCKDDRDRIFALQGVIAKEERTKVDYSQTCEQVYMTAACIVARSAVRDVSNRVAAASGDRNNILSTASHLHHHLERIRKLFVEFANMNSSLDGNSVDEQSFTTWKIRMGMLLWQIDKAADEVRETGLYHDPLEQHPGAGERVYWLEMTENSGILEWGTRDKPCRLGPGLSYSGPEEELDVEMARLINLLGDPGDLTTVIPDKPYPWYHETGES